MEYLICQHANDTVCCRRSQVGKLQFCCEVKQMRYFVLKYFDNIHGEKLKWKMRSTPAWRILGSFQKKLRIYCCQEWCEGIALFGRSEICSFHNLLWICFAACLKGKNASLIMKHSWEAWFCSSKRFFISSRMIFFILLRNHIYNF